MRDPRHPNAPDGWHSRGYLPHFDGGEIPQFITFRLADSMPQSLLDTWRKELACEQDIHVDSAFRKRIELYLDQGYGECHLKDLRVAEVVQNAMLFFDGQRYRLAAWVVMPNHAHALLTPCAGNELSDVMHSLKSYTANEANSLLNRTGQFWQPESFDRWIRDADHFAKVISYIENNPVKARLCQRPEDWPFSSAWFRNKR
ncbi:MAG TPA: transposase [Pyrinomonadaceae bacterium]|nr:transposase [Pyrinomonadaceae bacterium]